MKRADLTVGQEYLVHDSNDWAIGGGWSPPRRYLLLSLEKMAELGHRYGYQPATETVRVEYDGIPYTVNRARKGTAHDTHSLAVMLHLETNTGRPVAPAQAVLIPFSKVRAPWAEGKAIVDEHERKAAAARKAKADAANERAARAQAISDRAALLTVSIQPTVSSVSTMPVHLAALERLLDLAEQAVNL